MPSQPSRPSSWLHLESGNGLFFDLSGIFHTRCCVQGLHRAIAFRHMFFAFLDVAGEIFFAKAHTHIACARVLCASAVQDESKCKDQGDAHFFQEDQHSTLFS